MSGSNTSRSTAPARRSPAAKPSASGWRPQIGSGLTGVLYVLDEPTIGLHPRDNARLLKALHHLRNLGNTLLLVEHDREVIASADYLFDFGPGAGRHGGEITAEGIPAKVLKSKASLTGQYLSGQRAIPVPTNRRIQPNAKRKGQAESLTEATVDVLKSAFAFPHKSFISILGARQHNLRRTSMFTSRSGRSSPSLA